MAEPKALQAATAVDPLVSTSWTIARHHWAERCAFCSQVRRCPEKAMQNRLMNPTRNFLMCKQIIAEGTCRFGDTCQFAHSEVCLVTQLRFRYRLMDSPSAVFLG